MQTHVVLERMRKQAAELASQDIRELEVVRKQAQELEDALTVARGRESVLAEKARAATELLSVIDQDLQCRRSGTEPTSAPTASDGAVASPGALPTVGEAIRGFLRGREKATRQEIIQHVRTVRPGTKHPDSELKRLTRRGVLVRPQAASYRLADEHR